VNVKEQNASASPAEKQLPRVVVLKQQLLVCASYVANVQAARS